LNQSKAKSERPWKGVLFPCCGVYGRIYRSVASGLFEGNCPKCGQAAKASLSLVLAMLFLLLLGLPAQSVHAAPIKPGFTEIPLDESEKVALLADSLKSDSLQTQVDTDKKDSSFRTFDKPQSRKEILDSTRLGLFLQTGISFLSFADRKLFTQKADSLKVGYLRNALTSEDSAKVKAQAFQMVNFCFPVSAGLDFKVSRSHYLAIGAGYLHDRESIIITDANSSPHSYYYAIQAAPLFLEWRIRISERFLTLDGKSDFQFSARWWWLLGNTEIYSSWGVLPAQNSWSGNGWSVSFGYLIGEWKSIRIHGDLGYASIQAGSEKPWSMVVPGIPQSESSTDGANWSMGGLQLTLRATVPLWKN
jgi:hypothetical protein